MNEKTALIYHHVILSVGVLNIWDNPKKLITIYAIPLYGPLLKNTSAVFPPII